MCPWQQMSCILRSAISACKYPQRYVSALKPRSNYGPGLFAEKNRSPVLAGDLLLQAGYFWLLRDMAICSGVMGSSRNHFPVAR